ncbi:hypothetical protein [Legionella taurinensis]|uniref:Uncharacterized protein n=1 Tax=Legionella taurinensis TaxID=70611 RepID=A0A3A5L7J6_9GAMM|nr:hypothetical protein [Legionella taurinensis]RJT47275.1 hypothetical protein D6J04_06810 [Legionella taurinensis]RJT68551.1 hypothetical protein D6J03_03720 [Legionella taurinensis]STY27451.1 Uncharacterised protein [Legionella taurinensis]
MDAMGAIVSILIPLLTGALAGAIVTAWNTNHINKRNNRIARLEHKINNLYGPLAFLMRCTLIYLENSRGLIQQHQDYFVPNKFSQSLDVQSKVDSQSNATIELSNYYFDKAIENNQLIFKLISENYSLIDSEEDEGLINEFVGMFIRLSVEYINPQIQIGEIPIEIQNNRGKLGTIASDFIDHIITKSKLLKEQLEKQTR